MQIEVGKSQGVGGTHFRHICFLGHPSCEKVFYSCSKKVLYVHIYDRPPLSSNLLIINSTRVLPLLFLVHRFSSPSFVSPTLPNTNSTSSHMSEIISPTCISPGYQSTWELNWLDRKVESGSFRVALVFPPLGPDLAEVREFIIFLERFLCFGRKAGLRKNSRYMTFSFCDAAHNDLRTDLQQLVNVNT